MMLLTPVPDREHDDAVTTTTWKPQDQIQPGDIVVFLGTPHRITRIDPPTPATLAFFPTCIGFARAADGWAISLDSSPFARIEVG